MSTTYYIVSKQKIDPTRIFSAEVRLFRDYQKAKADFDFCCYEANDELNMINTIISKDMNSVQKVRQRNTENPDEKSFGTEIFIDGLFENCTRYIINLNTIEL